MKTIRKIIIYFFNPYTYFIEHGIEFRKDNYTNLIYYKEQEKTIDGNINKWIRKL